MMASRILSRASSLKPFPPKDKNERSCYLMIISINNSKQVSSSNHSLLR